MHQCALFVLLQRRDGRVVYCVCLENRRLERVRGFESLSLRPVAPIDYSVGVFLFNPYLKRVFSLQLQLETIRANPELNYPAASATY